MQLNALKRLWTKSKWPRRLVIMHHGQSEQNLAQDIGGLTESGLMQLLERMRNTRDKDIPLTDIGRWQAAQTGRYLAMTAPFDICLSSPYRRALQTAELIVQQFPTPIRIYQDDRLREKEFGTLHGLTKDQIRSQFPHEHFVRTRDGKYNYRLPGGENYPDVGQRVHSIGDKLARDYGGKDVLVITHHVPAVMFVAMFEHYTEEQVLASGDIANCGIVEYILDRSQVPEGRMKRTRFNFIAYR